MKGIGLLGLLILVSGTNSIEVASNFQRYRTVLGVVRQEGYTEELCEAHRRVLRERLEDEHLEMAFYETGTPDNCNQDMRAPSRHQAAEEVKASAYEGGKPKVVELVVRSIRDIRQEDEEIDDEDGSDTEPGSDTPVRTVVCSGTLLVPASPEADGDETVVVECSQSENEFGGQVQSIILCMAICKRHAFL